MRVSVVAARTNNRLLSTPYRTDLGECADQKLQHYSLHKDILHAMEKKLLYLEAHLP